MRLRIVRIRLIALSVLCSVAITVAAQEPEYGYEEKAFENVVCHVKASISGVSKDGDHISGTNVMLNLSAGARFNEAVPGTDPYDDAKFYRAVLTIGGEEVYTREYEVSSDGGGGGGPVGFMLLGGPIGQGSEFDQDASPPGVRFASNHFTHLDDVLIELDAFFALFKNGVQIATGIVKTDITPKSYNMLATWMATHWNNDIPLPSPIQNDLIRYMNKLRAGYQNAEYGMDDDDMDFNQSSALAEIEVATSTSPNTHGSPTGIQVTGPQSNGWLTWAEIGAATQDGESDASPPHSIVILYSCETFPAKVTIASSFRLTEPSLTNHVYLGFPIVMSWDCDDSVTGHKVGSDF